jgi:aromatic-L-amino-acid/L-tryptophan decarboxylase
MPSHDETTYDDEDRALELDGHQLRELVDAVMVHASAYIDSIPSRASEGVNRAVQPWPTQMPLEATPLEDVLRYVFEQLVVDGYNTTSPGFFGYLGGGGLPQAAVADMIAGIINRFVGRWAAAPTAVELEANVIRWLLDMVGFPEHARGVMTSGGSLANLTAIFAARQHYIGIEGLDRARLYASDQIHFSVRKAAIVCGLPPACLRIVPSDARGRIDPRALAQMIKEDQEDGLRPFAVVASAGTFINGVVDDISAVSAITRQHGLWLHIDAAYGGFFLLTQRGRELMGGIEDADSISLDPHKSLFLPYGTGVLLVRNGAALAQANRVEADFYGPLQDDHIDFCSYSLEQTRPFRSLRLWLPLMLHGVNAFRRSLEEKLDLGVVAARKLRSIPDLQVIGDPMLTIVVFRLAPAWLDSESSAALNRELLEQVNAKGHAFLMGVHLKGEYVLRMCILSFRSHIDRVEQAVADIEQVAARLCRISPGEPRIAALAGPG